MKVKFPKYMSEYGRLSTSIRPPLQWHRYYPIHYDYIKSILISAGCDLEEVDPQTHFNFKFKTAFELLIDNKLVLIDFNDHLGLSIKSNDLKKYKCIFKLHYVHDLHHSYGNVFPFSPVSFNNWNEYDFALKNYKYTCTGKVINKQAIAGNAIQRRTDVREILKGKFDVNFDIVPQPSFFKLINDCIVSVCVPGARNNMLDRGQHQYMALGACTISPKLVTILSWNKPLIPNIHYIECKGDYSNLIEVIEWCIQNKEKCIEVGKNAQKLFEETGTPVMSLKWIEKCLSTNE